VRAGDDARPGDFFILPHGARRNEALLRGDIQLLVDGSTLLATHAVEGRIKAFVTLAKRIGLTPNTRTRHGQQWPR